GLRVSRASEVTGQRLLADDVLPRGQRASHHVEVGGGGRADVDDIDLVVGQEVVEAVDRLLESVGVRHVRGAPRVDICNRSQLDVDSVDLAVPVDVEPGSVT